MPNDSNTSPFNFHGRFLLPSNIKPTLSQARRDRPSIGLALSPRRSALTSEPVRQSIHKILERIVVEKLPVPDKAAIHLGELGFVANLGLFCNDLTDLATADDLARVHVTQEEGEC